MLTEIPQSQAGMADDFPFIQLFVPQEDAEERGLAGAVSADKANLDVIDNRGLGVVQENLVSVTFTPVFYLQEHCNIDFLEGK